MGVEPGLQESIQANVDFLQGVRAQAWDPRTMLSNLANKHEPRSGAASSSLSIIIIITFSIYLSS
jgi:hypothetical protein